MRNLNTHYVFLKPSGASVTVPGGEAFWSQSQAALAAYGHGWLLSEYEFTHDWPQWEIHPEADEVVRLMGGAADLHLEMPHGVEIITLAANDAYVIPKGIWHTLKVLQPCRMLHVTMGAGTRHRPV